MKAEIGLMKRNAIAQFKCGGYSAVLPRIEWFLTDCGKFSIAILTMMRGLKECDLGKRKIFCGLSLFNELRALFLG